MNADRINEHYFGDLAEAGTQRCRQRIHWICSHVTGERILDIGCSQGIVCLILAREGFLCTGIDIEPASLAFAAKELEKEDESVRKRISFQLASTASLAFEDKQFDTVILGEILEHLTHPAKMLQEACRVLKDNGSLVVTVPLGLLPFHDHKQTYYPLSLIRQLEPFVTIAQLELLDGYIAVRGCKTAVKAVQNPAQKLQRVEEITAQTESHFLKSETEYYQRINQLTQACTTANNRIRELIKTTTDLQNEIAERRREQEANAAQLQKKVKEITNLTDTLATANSRLDEKVEEGEALRIKVAEYCGELRSIHGLLDKQSEEILVLRHKLVEAENEWKKRVDESEARFESTVANWQNKLKVAESQSEKEIERLNREYQFTLAEKTEELKTSKTTGIGDRLLAAFHAITNPRQVGKFGRQSHASGSPVESVTTAAVAVSQNDNLVDNIRMAVFRTIPIGASVAVISKGDERLLELIGRNGMHFPQTEDGTYAGYYPANGAEAITHLEKLMQKGAGYLLIPSTSFWWLDYYGELKEYLVSRNYLLGFQDDTCMIFALQARPAELTHNLPVYYEPKASGKRASNGGRQKLPSVGNLIKYEAAPSRADLRMAAEDRRELSDEYPLYHLLGAKTPADPKRVLLYGNVNTNAIDGSSVWLINVARLLSLRYKVDLLLKAKITTWYLLSELEDIENINIISPDSYPSHMEYFGDSNYLEDYSAAELITKLDMENNYHFVFCRGKFVNYYLSLNPNINHKLVAYFLIDYYKSEDQALDVEVSLLQNILCNAAVVVAQTQMLKDFVCDVFKDSGDRIVLLPPMVAKCVEPLAPFTNRSNLCLYAGKFDLEWRIDDIINVCEQAEGRLQLVGNKFHAQQVGDQKLKAWILDKAKTADNIDYLGAVDHKDMPLRIDESDFSISVRTDRYLASREFSTKILEFGARGKPTIMNDSPINRMVVGDDYPLFANTNEELAACLKRITDPDVYARSARMCFEAARRSQMEELVSVCDDIEARLESPVPGRRVVVISDDKNYCDSFKSNPGGADDCRVIKVLLPRMAEIRHDSLRRLLWWADIINVHAQQVLDQNLSRIINEADKVIVSTGVNNPGLSREVFLRDKVEYERLLEHSNSLDVSVIVPCWNVPPSLLERALDSIVKQDGIDRLRWEIIIVDDASDSPVLDALPGTYRNNKKIRVVRNRRNKGLGISRNVGFERSRGRYIFYLDADDYFGENFFKGMLQELKRHDVVLGKMIVHREDEGVYEADNYINHAIAEMKDRKGGLRKVITAVSACVKAYDRNAIEGGRLYFMTGYHEDIYPWIRFVVENFGRIRIGYSESAAYHRTIRGKQSNQITMDSRIADARLRDLDIARSMVLTLLKRHNSDGVYNHLIAWYERLLKAGHSNGNEAGNKTSPIAPTHQPGRGGSLLSMARVTAH